MGFLSRRLLSFSTKKMAFLGLKLTRFSTIARNIRLSASLFLMSS